MATPEATTANPAIPPVEKIKVKVDGRELDVPKTMADPISGKPLATTMIQACALANIDVPHYCYHPKLPVAGNCRMCLVEYGTPAVGPDRKPIMNPDGTSKIAKSPRPAIACATPISPGMEIYTNTPAVKQMREGVLEFLLINHPLDCPICDQAGECKLQEYSVDYGRSESRFAEPKVHKPKQVDLGPRIVLDDERCILCTRCIRFTKDIVGDDALRNAFEETPSGIETFAERDRRLRQQRPHEHVPTHCERHDQCPQLAARAIRARDPTDVTKIDLRFFTERRIVDAYRCLALMPSKLLVHEAAQRRVTNVNAVAREQLVDSHQAKRTIAAEPRFDPHSIRREQRPCIRRR